MKTNFNTDEIKVVLHRLMFAVTTFIKWLACPRTYRYFFL